MEGEAFSTPRQEGLHFPRAVAEDINLQAWGDSIHLAEVIIPKKKADMDSTQQEAEEGEALHSSPRAVGASLLSNTQVVVAPSSINQAVGSRLIT